MSTLYSSDPEGIRCERQSSQSLSVSSLTSASVAKAFGAGLAPARAVTSGYVMIYFTTIVTGWAPIKVILSFALTDSTRK